MSLLHKAMMLLTIARARGFAARAAVRIQAAQRRRLVLRTMGIVRAVCVLMQSAARARIAAVVGVGCVVGWVAASLLLGGALLLLALALPLLLFLDVL